MTVYSCVLCEYKTPIMRNFDRHCSSIRHNKLHNIYYKCPICNKEYKNKSSLWYHNKKCKIQLDLLKEEFKTELTEIKETITHNNDELNEIKEAIVHNNDKISDMKEEISDMKEELSDKIENNKPIHNHFNLNIFLNEKCKNALNWDDFIKNLEITFDVDSSMTENISRMICSGINELGIYNRPIHCTDAKRKKLYIKNNNEWNNDQSTIPKTSNKLQQRFNTVITEWERKNPNWREDEDKMMEYVQLMNKLGEEIKYNKCINQIVKTTVIPKDQSNDLTLES
jgi:hypothetical protein